VISVIGHSATHSVSVSGAAVTLLSVGVDMSGAQPVQISSGSVVLVSVGVNSFFPLCLSRLWLDVRLGRILHFNPLTIVLCFR
jgi:hypothetical protein